MIWLTVILLLVAILALLLRIADQIAFGREEQIRRLGHRRAWGGLE